MFQKILNKNQKWLWLRTTGDMWLAVTRPNLPSQTSHIPKTLAEIPPLANKGRG